MMMNNSVVRIGLALVAAFYVVTGGLWAADYFPLQKFYAQQQVRSDLMEKLGFDAAIASKEYQEAEAYSQAYAVSSPGVIQTENKLAFYRALLFWGTVALGVGGGVLLATRRGRMQRPPGQNSE